MFSKKAAEHLFPNILLHDLVVINAELHIAQRCFIFRTHAQKLTPKLLENI